MTTQPRSLVRPLCVGLLFLVPRLALAGPNEGGTLILHANPGLVFTSDIQNYCGMSALDSCSAAVTSLEWDPGRKLVFHAIAAFPPESQPRLKALSFGIDYDPTKFVMVARGTCADFEIPGIDWLAPGTGTSQSWTTGTRTGLLTEVYWFAGYGYSEQSPDSTSVSLIPHPLQHGVFVDDAFPAEVDTIAGYGRLGFGAAGHSPCPGIEPLSPGDGDGLAGPEEPDSPDEPQEPVDGPPAADPVAGAAFASNALALYPDCISSSWGCWTFLSCGEAETDLSEVVLLLDGLRISASQQTRTTPNSRLWTFEFPPADSALSAVVELSWHSGRTDTGPLTTIVSRTRRGDYYNDRISLTTARGAMGYDTTLSISSVQELQNPAPGLRRMLQYLGITQVRKIARGESESVPRKYLVRGIRGSDRMRSIWRAYSMTLGSDECVLAIRAIAGLWPEVEESRMSARVEPDTDIPCDMLPYDQVYPTQWNLKNKVNTGFYGIGVNYPWCRGYGAGGRIGIIDAPFPSHSEIAPNVQGGDPLCSSPSVNCSTHGMACASVAAAARQNTGMVGVAPDAAIVPVLFASTDPDEDDIINTVWRVPLLLSGTSPAVVSMSWHMHAEEFAGDLKEAVRAVVDSAGIPFFCSTSSESYPGFWDQGNPNTADRLVMSVAGSRKNGYHYASAADIHAPGEALTVAAKVGEVELLAVVDNETGSYAAPQVAAVALLYWLQYSGCTPLEIYSKLLTTASTGPDDTRIVNATSLFGMTGINDITEVSVSAGSSQVTVLWEVTDPENIDYFLVQDSPWCWGPFEESGDPFAPGDSRYTSDGVHYAFAAPTPYLRQYAFRLIAYYNSLAAVYNVSGSPTSGTAVDPPDTPLGLDFTVESLNEARLRWTKIGSWPGQPTVKYWVYRQITAGILDNCGPFGAWGAAFRARVPHDGITCTRDMETEYACFYDSDLSAGLPYAYRVAAATVDPQGKVMATSGLSAQVVGYTEQIAEVRSAWTTLVAPHPRLSIRPNPASSSSPLVVSLQSSECDIGDLDLFDVAGRWLGTVPSGGPVGPGMSEFRLPELRGWVGSATGVFFLRSRRTGAPTARLVVIR